MGTVTTFTDRTAAERGERSAFAQLSAWYATQHGIRIRDDGVVIDSMGRVVVEKYASVQRSPPSARRLPSTYFIANSGTAPNTVRNRIAEEIGDPIDRPTEWNSR